MDIITFGDFRSALHSHIKEEVTLFHTTEALPVWREYFLSKTSLWDLALLLCPALEGNDEQRLQVDIERIYKGRVFEGEGWLSLLDVTKGDLRYRQQEALLFIKRFFTQEHPKTNLGKAMYREIFKALEDDSYFNANHGIHISKMIEPSQDQWEEESSLFRYYVSLITHGMVTNSKETLLSGSNMLMRLSTSQESDVLSSNPDTINSLQMSYFWITSILQHLESTDQLHIKSQGSWQAFDLQLKTRLKLIFEESRNISIPDF